jgi:hypothetical protein
MAKVQDGASKPLTEGSVRKGGVREVSNSIPKPVIRPRPQGSSKKK